MACLKEPQMKYLPFDGFKIPKKKPKQKTILKKGSYRLISSLEIDRQQQKKQQALEAEKEALGATMKMETRKTFKR